MTTQYNNRVDYFLTSPEVTLSNTEVVNTDVQPPNRGSDHKPVWITIPIYLKLTDFRNVKKNTTLGGSNPKWTGTYNNTDYILKGEQCYTKHTRYSNK